MLCHKRIYNAVIKVRDGSFTLVKFSNAYSSLYAIAFHLFYSINAELASMQLHPCQSTFGPFKLFFLSSFGQNLNYSRPNVESYSEPSL